MILWKDCRIGFLKKPERPMDRWSFSLSDRHFFCLMGAWVRFVSSKSSMRVRFASGRSRYEPSPQICFAIGPSGSSTGAGQGLCGFRKKGESHSDHQQPREDFRMASIAQGKLRGAGSDEQQARERTQAEGKEHEAPLRGASRGQCTSESGIGESTGKHAQHRSDHEH